VDIETIKHLVTRYGPYAVCLGSVLDNTGIPMVFLVGLVVTKAQALPPQQMLVAAGLGSLVGDLAFYAIGRYWLTKKRIVARTLGRRAKPLLDAGERAMRRWGVLAVVFGRFVPYAGKAMPFLAGSCKLSWPRAFAATCTGGFLLMGFYYFYADAAIAVVTGRGTLVTIVSLVVLTAAIAALWWANRVLSKRVVPKADTEAP